MLRRIFVLALPVLLSACATVMVSREPSTYLMNTDKPQTKLIDELQTLLKDNKYEIKTLDVQSGILITKPRTFSYGSGEDKGRAKHVVQVRQEGGSVSVRIVYNCEYTDKAGETTYGDCNSKDEALDAKIKKFESTLVRLIRSKVEIVSAG